MPPPPTRCAIRAISSYRYVISLPESPGGGTRDADPWHTARGVGLLVPDNTMLVYGYESKTLNSGV